jgi:hypothetical protein
MSDEERKQRLWLESARAPRGRSDRSPDPGRQFVPNRQEVAGMILVLMAMLCAGLFAGAAIYISLVEHPARLECGIELAVAEFGPSYRRAAVMQASLAAVGCVFEPFLRSRALNLAMSH